MKLIIFFIPLLLIILWFFWIIWKSVNRFFPCDQKLTHHACYLKYDIYSILIGFLGIIFFLWLNMQIWKNINKLFPCKQNLMNSFPCFWIYDLWVMWITFILIILIFIHFILSINFWNKKIEKWNIKINTYEKIFKK